jgi:2-desacetyl-2-hydroxyethyl bacteriochlorophyllide A dehydrogenase
MRRIVLRDHGSAVVEEVPEPKPGPGELSLKIAYSGICGSDLHASMGQHPFIPLPATPGHEFSGKVHALGEGVKGFNIGDRVICEPNLVCGECYNCRTGRYNICENLRVMGCQGEGAMADYFVVPAHKTIHIPEQLSLKDSVLVEPLAVGVHAVRRGGDLFRKNVVVIGAGTIGLMVLNCVKEAGAKSIIVTDLDEHRLQIADEIGATQIINASRSDVVKTVGSERPYEGIDVVFECVGKEKSIREAMAIVRKGGRIIVAGVFGSDTRVRMVDVQDRELELVGTIMYTRRDITDAVEMLAAGKCRPELFISRIYPLEKAQEAFEAARDTKNNMKVLFEVTPD